MRRTRPVFWTFFTRFTFWAAPLSPRPVRRRRGRRGRGAGNVFLSIAGAGVGEFRRDGSASLLTSSAATRLAADPLGDLTAYVPGQGVVQYRPSVGVRVLFPDVTAVPALAADDNGDFYADLSGYGLFEYDPFFGWHRLNAADVTLLAVA